MENLGWGLQMTVLGMGLVFALLALLWGLLTLVLRLDVALPIGDRTRGRTLPASAGSAAAGDATSARRCGGCQRADGMPADLVAAIMVAVLTHRADAPARSRAGDAQLLARQPALRVALGRDGPRAPESQLAAERKIMRRYTLDIGGREFSIDVQELAADRFEVVVGDETYDVTLAGDEDLPEAMITPGFAPAPAAGGATRSPAAPVATRAPATPVATRAPATTVVPAAAQAGGRRCAAP